MGSAHTVSSAAVRYLFGYAIAALGASLTGVVMATASATVRAESVRCPCSAKYQREDLRVIFNDQYYGRGLPSTRSAQHMMAP